MTALAKSLPIYDAIIALATDDERADILAAGPRCVLYDNSTWADESEYQSALRAYAAIKQVLIRVSEDPNLRITGIKTGSLSREPLAPEVVVSGRLMWLESGGRNGALFVDWSSSSIRIDNVKIEPIGPIVANKATRPVKPSLSASAVPAGGTKKRPSDVAVKRWMEETLTAAVATGVKPKRDNFISDCRSALGCTHAQALATWNDLPQNLKRKRGRRGNPPKSDV